jgi:hypothetical protein
MFVEQSGLAHHPRGGQRQPWWGRWRHKLGLDDIRDDRERPGRIGEWFAGRDHRSGLG